MMYSTSCHNFLDRKPYRQSARGKHTQMQLGLDSHSTRKISGNLSIIRQRNNVVLCIPRPLASPKTQKSYSGHLSAYQPAKIPLSTRSSATIYILRQSNWSTVLAVEHAKYQNDQGGSIYVFQVSNWCSLQKKFIVREHQFSEENGIIFLGALWARWASLETI